ncbi:MAG: hypothetical protein AAF618_06185 [Pseudomonadota bacterium]
MQLSYDIDFSAAGADRGAHFASFRDPETAAAARRASPRTRAILREAGLSLRAVPSDVPQGHYALRDSARHEYFLRCFVEALTEEPDDGEAVAPGEFDLSQCLISLSAARPYGALVPRETKVTQVVTQSVSKAVYLAVSLMAASGYIAGFAVLS